jgi:hypothetical protein
MENKYEHYSELITEIECLKEEKERLRAEILEQMIANQLSYKKTPYGYFQKVLWRKWIYSDQVNRLIRQTSEQKKKERQNPDTRYEKSKMLLYKPIIQEEKLAI